MTTQVDIQRPSLGAELGRALRIGWQADAVLYIFLLPYCLSWLWLNAWLTEGPVNNLSTFMGVIMMSTFVAIVFIVAWDATAVLLGGKVDSPLRAFAARVKSRAIHWRDGVKRLPVFLGVLLMSATFVLFKGSISYALPFSWDLTFDNWDRILHFGYRPWELLQPALGHPLITILIFAVYGIVWYQLMLGVMFYYALLAPVSVRRTQVLLVYLFVFAIAGSYMATAFSSAGPVYFDHIGIEPNPYKPLINYLGTVNSYVLPHPRFIHETLWWSYDQKMAAGGISAMPSVHNATAMIFVLVAWQAKPWIRYLMIVIFAIIFLGSIHLAWHYALDAYLAWAVTLASWWAAGLIARRWHARDSILVATN
jgi:hypothetical protein